MSFYDGEIRRIIIIIIYITRDTEARWLLKPPHVKINIYPLCVSLFFIFCLKRLFPSRGRARDGTFSTTLQ